MILRAGSEDLIAELNDELASQTLGVWNSGAGGIFSHYVPWMSVLPSSEQPPNEPALHHIYQPGDLLTSPHLLTEITEYFTTTTTGTAIQDNLAVNLPSTYAIAIDMLQRQPWAPERYSEAVSLVTASHPYFAQLFLKLVRVTIPIYLSKRHVSMSSDLARGAVFIGFEESDTPWDIAISMAHEFGHQALMVLNSADPFLESSIDEPVFSGVRLTERPAIQSMHAAVALAFMLLFVKSSRDGPPLSRRAALIDSMRDQLLMTISALTAKCHFSELGQAVIEDFTALSAA